MGQRIGDLRQADLVTIINDLMGRVAALERQAGLRALTLVSLGVTLGQTSTSFQRMAWTSFPRSGSQVSVDVSVNLAGASSMDVQLRADGAQIDTKNVTASGIVTLSGFLSASWPFGGRREVDVQAKLNTPTASASSTVAIVAAAHR